MAIRLPSKGNGKSAVIRFLDAIAGWSKVRGWTIGRRQKQAASSKG